MNAANTGTIFDSPWFALERGGFKSLSGLSDMLLTWLLIIGAIVILWIALNPKTPPLLKAVVLAYIILP
jgi:uncharacterized membrane-anchored protein